MSEEYRHESDSRDDCPPPIDLDHTLFVIFHGAIAFYDDPSLPWIDAMVADLKDDHVYVCGKFLGELRIPKGSSMALSGVLAGDASFNSNRLDFVHYPGPRDTGTANIHLDNVYSRFAFPRPDQILHAFNFTQDPGGDSRKLCIVPVFQYRFEDVHNLRLRIFLNFGQSCSLPQEGRGDCFHWSPSGDDPTPMTLHIRAEEDSKDQQPERDFDAAAEILEDVSNLNLDLWKNFDRGDPLPGFNKDRTFWEVDLSLSDRVKWLTGVGARIERHPPSAGSRFVIEAPPSPTDDAPSCGPDSGGPGA
jgi:hypothetical protein